MSVTVAPVRGRDSTGNQFETITDVTLTGTYPAGGEPVTAQQLGLTFVQKISETALVSVAGTGTAVDSVALPQTDGSVKLKLNTATGEIAASGVNAGTVVRVVAAGY